MKVGLIRGAYLSQFEMQTYEHLLPDIQLEAYHIRINRFPVDDIHVPIRRMHSIDDPITMVSSKLGFYFNLFLQATCGLDYYHFGLLKALADKDIAHTMETFNAFSYQALQAKRRYGTKLVVTVWENRPYAAERFEAKRRMKYEVIQGADLFLVMTPRAAHCLTLEGADERKIKVLPIGINLKRFQPRPKPIEWMKRFGLHEEEFIILSVAALLWEKGVHEILHAFKQLTLDYPHRRLRLVYAGSGGEKGPLQDLARRIGLQEHVSFLRFPYKEMHYAYNMADIFVLASAPRKGWLEQFGYVLAEALASGAPIITTLSGSIPEVVGDAAMLIPPSDFLALRDAMNDLILNPERSEELSQKGRAWAERHYDNQKNALKIRKAYEELF